MTTKAESIGQDPKGDTKICKVCKIPFSDIFAYAEHLESKQHMKGVMKKKYGEKYLAAKAKLDEKDLEEEIKTPVKILSVSKEISKPVKEVSNVIEKPVRDLCSSAKDSSNSDDNSDDDEVYTCEVCKKVCTGLLTYQLHLQGKKHQKNVKKVTLLKEMKEQKLIPEVNDEPKEETLFDRLFPQLRHVSPNLECKVCKKKCLGPEAYKQHCRSESHKKKVAIEELLKGMETEGLSPAKDQNDDSTPVAHCDLCNKGFSGPLPFMQHMKSTAHLKQARHLQELGKIKNLIISKEEDSKFKCKECGKMFSGPVPFNAHLKSSAHGKMKKKTALMDNLEKKHPELIKTLAAQNSDESDEDDSVLLGCKVCHMVFSGPEAANDHFTSSKHKKAVKKKAMFKKFKQQQKAGKLLASSNGAQETKKSDSNDSSEFEEEFDIIQDP
ncbi:hypothetical protein AVEN_27261-1 [Araneus ventricosus]|uniref:C2H2-type domain-containing protein n=1 Tax=Araneus ventricosus TaxID=182803 RepID=A0A4Y2CCV4_ARAVE|nr:hypothetical protein AVEN_27261-1 [Araneus ventricosus]